MRTMLGKNVPKEKLSTKYAPVDFKWSKCDGQTKTEGSDSDGYGEYIWVVELPSLNQYEQLSTWFNTMFPNSQTGPGEFKNSDEWRLDLAAIREIYVRYDNAGKILPAHDQITSHSAMYDEDVAVRHFYRMQLVIIATEKVAALFKLQFGGQWGI